jgi:hypothetical protein
MVRKKETPSDSKKIGIVFTLKQIGHIDKLVKNGDLGGNRAEIIKQIVMFYLKEKDDISNF